ncbi:hypothetical protein CYMTET_47838 [Cymbomonas tetramitiformis]|uniref:Uncharacterized protein n=1 Tax=Cymbomonas tetramitiformis TaxID=36881 RepID=A0AAE0BTD9_9CHLO|nr:hypothetical protein CYMTET_47838 [Cymbomonas tetramitiformis]
MVQQLSCHPKRLTVLKDFDISANRWALRQSHTLQALPVQANHFPGFPTTQRSGFLPKVVRFWGAHYATTRQSHPRLGGFTGVSCCATPAKPVEDSSSLSTERPSLLEAAYRFPDRPAIVSADQTFSYADLLVSAQATALEIQSAAIDDAEAIVSKAQIGPRVAIMVPPGAEYVASTWATWMCGGVVVPLAISNPPSELEYVIKDSKANVVLGTQQYEEVLQPICELWGLQLVVVGAITPDCGKGATVPRVPHFAKDTGALIIYTSGTTGRPKGVLHTHKNLISQVRSLTDAWEWSQDDRILHCLPLHHIHGIVNALYCAHYNGALVEFMPSFSPGEVWKRLMRQVNPVTVFMGVPTMYVILMRKFEGLGAEAQRQAAAAAAALRLTVSGSAACPVSVMASWEKITGQRLLERYGMTEIGMALSNPLKPMHQRRAGTVGRPLPSVEVRIGGLGPTEVGQGELGVRGSTVFCEYFGRAEATASSFDRDGYFLTGDTAEVDEDGVYTILGRTSVDIIKSGGYKLSALEIENHLLEHPSIRECAVVGLPDEVYGEIVAAVIVCEEGEPPLEGDDLRVWAKDHMAIYKIPRVTKVLDGLPRNAMGKVNKKELIKSVFPSE